MINDNNTTVTQLKEHIDAFCADRNWNHFENPKNLAMALSVETAELVEIFQWLNMEQAENICSNTKEFIHLQEEIADIFWYLTRICLRLDIDLTQCIKDKTVKNAKKYPVK